MPPLQLAGSEFSSMLRLPNFWGPSPIQKCLIITSYLKNDFERYFAILEERLVKRSVNKI